MNPNSAHQLWSRWTFRVWGRPVPLAEVEANVRRWLRMGFGSVGRARVEERIEQARSVVVIEAEVEGPPAHDPGYVLSVERQFARFVHQGWGPVATCRVDVEILAGDTQDGTPPKQLVVVGGLD